MPLSHALCLSFERRARHRIGCSHISRYIHHLLHPHDLYHLLQAVKGHLHQGTHRGGHTGCQT